MYFVYVLRSEKDGRLYKGFSSNLEKRIREHNSGKTKSTKGYLPWKLVYSEKVELKQEKEKNTLNLEWLEII